MRYEITLEPDLRAARFAGHEDVLLRVLASTDRIVLNAAELKVSSASLVGRSGSRVSCEPLLDEAEERLILRLDKTVPPGEWTLQVDFEGILNDKLHGFYRSVYRDADGDDQTIATTQFEATDARRAFPCWDEPDRKAVFAVSLDVDNGLNVYSNTRVSSTETLTATKKRVRFADTPKMSTYLVAFVVGPLVSTDPVDVDGVALSVVHAPGKAHLTPFALEVGAHALRYFTRWFGIDYPGDKLDLIAIPDFAFGAMENLGAVTFRETALLVDLASSSRVEQERIADVVSHEIAHMWFGDLVTMKWWNGIWLNEAFATFAEMACVDAFRPNWQRWVTFGISRSAAMATDELSTTRPIEFPVERPEEAQGMFDILTYEKGAGVLRMLEQYLGTDTFLDGLRRYLDAHLFGNAETTDLWDAIEDASSEPVRSVMDSWIFQGGHPAVGCSIESGPSGTALRLSQEPFRLDPARAGGPADAIGSDWEVPVQVRTVTAGTRESFRLLLGPDGAGLELTGDPDLVVVNAGGSGFYRSSYDATLLERCAGSLAELDAVEQFNLVSDSWAFALRGPVRGSDPSDPLAGFLRIVARLRSPDPNVWSTCASAVGLLDLVSGSETDSRAGLEAFVRDVFGGQLARIGRDPGREEDEKIGTLRAVLVRTLGTVGADADTRAWAAKIFDASRSDPAALPPDLAGAVVNTLAAAGDPAHYHAFLDAYRAPANPQEEVRYLFALPCFSERSLFAKTLELTLSEVRTQNAPFVLQLALANRDRGPDAWEFVKTRWSDLTSRFPDQMISRMLDTVSCLCTPPLAADVHAFVSEHPVKTGQRTVDQAVERLDVNVAFASRVAPDLARLISEALA